MTAIKTTIAAAAALALSACAGPAAIERAGSAVDELVAEYEEGKAATLKLFRDRAYFLIHRYKSTLEATAALRRSPRATPDEWHELMSGVEALETVETE